MKLSVPELSLIVLIGPSGSGKSTFAAKHFLPTEILSSDECRGLVSDDPNNQEATADAFAVLQYIAGKRLARGKLTVIDATNVQEEARRPLVQLAREHDVLPVAIVLKLPEEICRERNRARADRDFGPHVVRNQCMQLRRSLRGLEREGFRHVHVLASMEQVEAATIERQRLWTDRRDDAGPFDIIGDIHGCYDELVELLQMLGYRVSVGCASAHPDEHLGYEVALETAFVGCASAHADPNVAQPACAEAHLANAPDPASRGTGTFTVTPPAGRKVVFLGDLCDRGSKTPDVLRLVMSMVKAGTALCVPGNHDVKLLKKLRGRDVQIAHGLAQTLEQLKDEPPQFLRDVASFIDGLVSHYVLDGGQLVVAHAGMKQQYIGRASRRVREFALYGDTTGESDELGLPVRLDWAGEYRGSAAIIYGHTPVAEPQWHNKTINIDTGCVFGGKLTALRWPEKQLVSVLSHQTYAHSSRTFLPPPVLGEHREFGQRIEGIEYRARPGIYAIVPDDAGRIAVMKIGPENHFLPGGGSEPGESPHQTLAREIREECARGVRIIRRLGEATQLLSHAGNPIAKRGVYYEAAFTETLTCATEPDHELLWLMPREAIARLRHEAQKWAVQAWANARNIAPAIVHDDVLDIGDVLGKRIIHTRLGPSVTIREENAIAALEVMSRFAADPRWLIYLPATISPTETSRLPGLLEYPAEAFEYYRSVGVQTVVCEEKHMGSRAIVIVCRDAAAAQRRFGIHEENAGIVYTRTGRRFFEERAVEARVLAKIRQAMDAADFWKEFSTDWFCLDCELMPWSAKAKELLKSQYAAVGSAARAALPLAIASLEQSVAKHPEYQGLFTLLQEQRDRLVDAHHFVAAYRRYCWSVHSTEDLKLALFHLLASEGKVHADRDHLWHLQTISRLAEGDSSLLQKTRFQTIGLADPLSIEAATQWWKKLTDGGGEGMVVKPLQFVAKSDRGLVQPAVKCRGGEYLRIIYGPHYTQPRNLDRLRSRGLGAKRSLAIREFALGLEALERFVSREPLHRVHECVFGVLALESEPVDPRL